jgi:trehalose 6-phosphate synthase/phosphatase
MSGSGYLGSPNGDFQSPKDADEKADSQTPHWNANSYFAPKQSDPQTSTERPDSSTELARGVKTRAELLRRLSLVNSVSQPERMGIDPKTSHPGLHLTGNVISATVCIPYSVGLRPGGEWELTARHGTSALFDSFSHLSSSRTPWNHTLVGWTGEIHPVVDTMSPPQNPAEQILISSPSIPKKNRDKKPFSLSLNEQSAPIPVNRAQAAQPNPFVDGLTVTKSDRNRLERMLEDDPNGRVLPVWLSDEVDDEDASLHLKDQGRWRRYAEHELYTLFHYRQHGPDDGRAERKWWADYVRMNQLFADRILHVYQPGDIVWIHDYHLMLLPSILRQRVPNIYIGFFLHIPFPSSEFLRGLPRRKDILTGILGATMIGFQSYGYSRHFNSCCKRILGFESSPAGVDAYGAHVAVDVFPIGIDAGAVQRAAFADPIIEKNMASIRQLYAGKKIIVGRDRLDTVRGVSQKFQAFEIFLERYPEWRGKVVLIQVTSPTSVEEEKEDSAHKIEHKISSLVSKVNGEFGSLSYSPIQHYPQYLSSQEYFALLRIADVGLITSVRDGMNTTSLEYVICQKGHYGPLILSEFSGTAASLGNAIHINPWDLGGVADAIKGALEMDEQSKKANHEKLYSYVTTHTVSTWSNKFLKRLLTNLTSFSQSDLTPALDRIKMVQQYDKAKKRLFMFDYDGTLTPIVKDPHAAIPSDRVLRTLKALAADPKNAVWIISGRDEKFLDEWMGHISELGLSAEHGCFIRQPRSNDWENLTEKIDMGWQKEVMEVFGHFTERTQGSWIEKKRVALTWHYRQADPDFGAFQAKECRRILENTVAKKWEIEVMAGKSNLEVRPQFVNKGYIATRLVNEYGKQAGEPPEFVLCLGDDQTDEGERSRTYSGFSPVSNQQNLDMFQALLKTDLPKDQVFAVTVGASSKRTLASWHLLAPADVIASIAALNAPRYSGESQRDGQVAL